MKLLVTRFSLASVYYLLDPNIFLQDSVLAHSFCVLFPNMRPSFTPTQNNNTVIVLYILVFIFLDN